MSAFGGALAVLVLVGGAALLFARGGGDETTATTGEAIAQEEVTEAEVAPATTLAGASTASPVTVPSLAGSGPTLTWVPSETPLATNLHTAALIATQDGFAALRSGFETMALLTSEDGVTWESIATDLTGDAGYGGFAVTPDGQYLVAGNEWDFGNAAQSGFVASSSDGATWAKTMLEFPPPLFDDPLAEEHPFISAVAVGAEGAVVLGQMHFDINIGRLLEERIPGFGEGDMLGYGYSFGEDGTGEVEVTGTDNEEIFRATFEELGIDPAMVEAMNGPGSRIVLWHSTDLETWQRIDDPFPNSLHVDAIAASSSGFMANGGVETGPGLWTSPDGITWTAVAAPDRIHFSHVFAWEGGAYAIGDDPEGLSLWTSADGADWVALSRDATFQAPPGTNFSIDNAAAGSGGIVAIGSVYQSGPDVDLPPVTVESDGKRLVVASHNTGQTFTVTDITSGEVLTAVTVDYSLGVDPEALLFDGDTVVVIDPASGEHVFEVPEPQLAQAFETAFEEAYGDWEEPAFSMPQKVLWYSADGTTWSRQDLATAFGSVGYVSAAAMGDDVAIVAFEADPFGGREPTEEELEAETFPPQTQMWVGTPTP
jgi:hypothetical protein